MKRSRHALKQIQRRVINDVKRQERAKRKAASKKTVAQEPVADSVAGEELDESKARGVDRGTIYRNRSHPGYH